MREIYIQFTGTKSRYYTPETFLEEARRLGFGRVVPLPLRFGTMVGFAKYKPLPRIEGQHPLLGRAFVFAVGEVQGWHVQPRTPEAAEFWAFFTSLLKERGVVVKEVGGGVVRRRCGRYETSGGVCVREDADILDLLTDAIEQWNKQNPEKRVSFRSFKWIITGKLLHYSQHIGVPLFVVDGVKPTRSFVKVKLDLSDLQSNNGGERGDGEVLTVRAYTLADKGGVSRETMPANI